MAASAVSLQTISLSPNLSTTSSSNSSDFNGRQLRTPVKGCRRAAPVARLSAKAAECSQSSLQKSSLMSGLMASVLAASLQISPMMVGDAMAGGEVGIISGGPPTQSHYVDDAGVLSRVTKVDLKKLLTQLYSDTGYDIDVVTIRKLASKADVFDFADAVLEGWYPTVEEGDKKGVVVLVTTQKEGAVAGGPTFNATVGDAVLEGVITDNLPVLATSEKYNEAIYSSVTRLNNAIRGLPDIEGPKFKEDKRESNFKTKEQTANKRDQLVTVVGGLLVIAFVVPMLQFYAYVRK